MLRKKTIARKKIADWLEVDEISQPWIDALIHLDQNDDKSILIQLLKSQKTLPEIIRHHLADLIERYELKHPRGRHRTPSYDRSPKDSQLIAAKASIRKAKSSGKSLDQAIDVAARVYGLKKTVLHSYLLGKYGPSNRMKKRRPTAR
jgi:hypothetical protein